MAMIDLAARALRAIERISEDEGLGAELTDDAARALRSWAMDLAQAAGLDPWLDDAALSDRLHAIRRAALAAAARGGDAASVVAAAASALDGGPLLLPPGRTAS